MGLEVGQEVVVKGEKGTIISITRGVLPMYLVDTPSGKRNVRENQVTLIDLEEPEETNEPEGSNEPDESGGKSPETDSQ